jgi:hypothetical protein
MRVVFYWLEDHFEALAEARAGRLSRSAIHFVSRICADIGDSMNERIAREARVGHSELGPRTQ